jgi:hypothetical protein
VSCKAAGVTVPGSFDVFAAAGVRRPAEGRAAPSNQLVLMAVALRNFFPF